MSVLEKVVYLATALAFLVTWIPILDAFSRNEQRRLVYLVPILLYFFVQLVFGLGSLYNPRDNPVDLWSEGHTLRHSHLLVPLGYGLPLGLAAVLWDMVTGRRRGAPPSDAEFRRRIQQELEEQAREASRDHR